MTGALTRKEEKIDTCVRTSHTHIMVETKVDVMCLQAKEQSRLLAMLQAKRKV